MNNHKTINPFAFLMVLMLSLVGCNRPYLFYQEPQVQKSREKITVDTVIALSVAGVSEEIIIEKIKQNGLSQRLTKGDRDRLKKKGISEKVIGYLEKYQRPLKKKRYGRYYYYSSSNDFHRNYYWYDSPYPYSFRLDYSYPYYRSYGHYSSYYRCP